MVTTTLGEVPGRHCEPIRVVSVLLHVMPSTESLDALRRQLETQAAELKADAVIDVRLQMMEAPQQRPGPAQVTLALTGTAVKIVR